jgi:hypothetical protein
MRQYRFPSLQRFLSWLPVLIVILAGHDASASTIRLSFTGVVTSSNLPKIPIGATFTGSVTYQTPGAAQAVDGTNISYSFGPLDLLTVTTAGYTFSLAGANPKSSTDFLGVLQNFVVAGVATDAFSVGNNSEVAAAIDSDLPGFSPDFFVFAIAGPPGLLKSSALPNPETIDLNKVSANGFGSVSTGISLQTFGSPFPNPYFQGKFTSLEIGVNPGSTPVSGVPAISPSALAALGIILLLSGIVLLRRRPAASTSRRD